MRALICSLMFVLAAFVAGCTPEAARPLPDSMRVTADERLVGTWRAEILGNVHTVAVTRGSVAGTLVAEMTTRTATGGSGQVVSSRHVLSFYDFRGTRLIVEHGPSAVDRRPVYRYAAYDIGTDGAVNLRFTSEPEIDRWASPLRVNAAIRGIDPNFRFIYLLADSDTIAAVLGSKPASEMFNVAFGPFVRQ